MPESPDMLLERIRRVWQDDVETAFRLADEARQAYPDEPTLLIAWGDLNQLSEETTFDAEESFEAYRRAAEVDPLNGEAFESMGFFLDAIRDDPAAAEPFFRKAIELDAGFDSVIGLAQVLAQTGRSEEALRTIDESPFADEPEVKELRDEIVRGEWSE